MSGLDSLIDVAKYWQRWADPRLVVLVLNNRDLNCATWEQRVMEGVPRNPVTQTLPDVPTLPPELTSKQEDKLTQALAGGDDRAAGVPRQLQLQDVRQAAG